MKSALATAFDYSIPFARMIPMIRQAGFEVVSLGGIAEHSGYPTVEGKVKIRKLIEENGLEIDSVHAPLEGSGRLFSLDETERQEAVRQCKIAIDAAFGLGVGIVVIHSGVGSPEGDTQSRIIDKGIESIGALSKYTLGKGVKLAVENVGGPYAAPVLETVLTELSEDPIGFCYDSGHENMLGTCFETLERFGDRLLTVHLHDNWGTKDEHMLPYEGSIDWDGFRNVFHRLNYSGHLLLEPRVRSTSPGGVLSEARTRAERLLEAPTEQRGRRFSSRQ